MSMSTEKRHFASSRRKASTRGHALAPHLDHELAERDPAALHVRGERGGEVIAELLQMVPSSPVNPHRAKVRWRWIFFCN